MYIADLHIHSKYSRATSKTCVPEYLELWAKRKGIDLIGTGDFTHPAWREELREKLTPAEDGLFVLKDEYRVDDEVMPDAKPARFVVSGEISSIYKKNGKTRKVHNVILLPGLEEAETLSRRLEAIGNVHSDGRPILGLDSRDLLEITLEACPDAIFIPAHIWTPHFSLFGAFSGFDTIEECFEDLTPHIHALETGLSSDPAMNWRLSMLDGYTLVSNSDAHSPAKLGREANLLDTDLSYPALYEAIQEKKGFAGTIEFFPEEGKYHYDGHRNCHLCLKPSETIRFGGKCPVCGKKITIGVEHRVEELADRDEGYRPNGALPFESLAPLCEVIAASTGLSSASKKVTAQYEEILGKLGSEFYILRKAPIEDIRHAAGVCVAEGIRRLREGQVERIPGYDGEYGIIKILDEAEIKHLSGQTALLDLSAFTKQEETDTENPIQDTINIEKETSEEAKQEPKKMGLLDGLNQSQMEAVTAPEGAVAVVAGPGTGKTKTLVSRIAYLVLRQGRKPSEITAVTFTNKAADEMRYRLEKELGKRTVRAMTIGTFHAICLKLLTECGLEKPLVGENEAQALAEEVIRETGFQMKPASLLRAVSDRKNEIGESGLPEEVYQVYQKKLDEAGVMDLDDLLLHTLQLWSNGKQTAKQAQRFRYLLVDEFQDINHLQQELIVKWSNKSKGVFVIGDPDQSIYGFRGADAACFERFGVQYPDMRTIRLSENYRSTPEILQCALSVIDHNAGGGRVLVPHKQSGEQVSIMTAQSDLSEAIFVAKTINQMVGGIDMLDAYGFARPNDDKTVRSFSEIAVLYRTHRQGRLIEKCLRQEAIPYTVVGREDFLSDPIIRGAVALFRFLLNPDDLYSMRVSLKALCDCPDELCDRVADSLIKGEGEVLERIAPFREKPLIYAYVDWVQEYLARIHKEKPAKLIEAWADGCGLSESETMKRFINMAVLYDDMESFLKALVLGGESDVARSSGREYTSNAVTLMTLHGCKGLEFPVVFLCGVKEGSIPLESKSYQADVEEERRLFYVGMTRAEQELYLLTSEKPSMFLEEIPAEHTHRADTLPHKKQQAVQLSLFD
jgi:uncharacterized protein (TIGR00375 family)